jgi:2-oxoglutarate dehydrogenase complex dehydrogenase (E1) component-like enzyme
LQISTKLENGVNVSLLPNPSHLDAINPGAMGKVRSKQEKNQNSLCIQCHGDGSLIGQGKIL